jgi:hypothetical protein
MQGARSKAFRMKYSFQKELHEMLGTAKGEPRRQSPGCSIQDNDPSERQAPGMVCNRVYRNKVEYHVLLTYDTA